METAVSLKEQIGRAIVAHGQWKVRLAQAIEAGRSDFTIDVARADDRCEFGKWLYGLGRNGHDEQVRQIKEMHAAFHRAAADVLALALSARTSEAASAMGLSGQFGQLSTKLTLALSSWQRSVD